MLQKLRRAVIDPDRSLLEALVEIDKSDILYRTKDDPVAGGQRRSAICKLHIIGAIELSPDGLPRRRSTTLQTLGEEGRVVADVLGAGGTIPPVASADRQLDRPRCSRRPRPHSD